MRYFLEVSYKGTNYSGFQVQENAKTIQSEVEHALGVLFRERFSLTGSSRTDAGVHALQNFFHFDSELSLDSKSVYNLNALLPADIAANGIYEVNVDAHSRFGAIERQYKYVIYRKKDPLLYDRAWHYPYTIDHELLAETAAYIAGQQDFIAFSKRNSQVNNFRCEIRRSEWRQEEGQLIYYVTGNRFLRGMVRALVSSMLRVARGKMQVGDFKRLFTEGGQASADFSAPAHGLYLVKVMYPEGYLAAPGS